MSETSNTKDNRHLPFIEKLLEGGEEVEWKALGEICRLVNGRAYKRQELLEEGKYPVLRVGNFFTNANWFYSDLELEDDKYCNKGDLLYAWSASFGPKIWSGDKVIYHYHIWKMIPDVSIVAKKYLYYLLDWDTIALKNEQATGATMMHISKGVIEKRLFPIPSLKIQQEIVRILDTFTELTAALTAALTAREKQYAYYREQLLSFEEGEVEWKALGEISIKISSGGTPKTSVSSYYGGDIPWLRTQEVGSGDIWDTGIKITETGLKNSSAKMIPENCIIIAMYGATVGKVGVNKIPLSTNQACANVQLNSEIAHYRYVYHFLLKQYEYIKSLGAGSQTNINAKIVKNLLIPIPCPNDPEKSLKIQQEIVRMLDTFTELTAALTAELTAREKQYAYYRDLLFTFPKENVSV